MLLLSWTVKFYWTHITIRENCFADIVLVYEGWVLIIFVLALCWKPFLFFLVHYLFSMQKNAWVMGGHWVCGGKTNL
jgi:hypothetical protein